MEFKEHNISSGDGLPLYVREYGVGRSSGTIMCLGGLTRNSKDFHIIASRLKYKYRIIAPDYRGRGQSAYDPKWKNYNPRTYINDIHHISTALGVERFAVIGNSLGGILGMALGTATPSSLRGILLNDIAPIIPIIGLRPIINYMRNDSPLADRDAAVNYLQKTFPNFHAKSSEEWYAMVEATYRKNNKGQLVFDWDPNIIRNIVDQEILKINLWPYFNSICHLPILAVRGAMSPFVNDHTWKRMKNECPHMIQVTVPEVGHVPSLLEFEVSGVLNKWLENCFD